jgi:hypothetical protein
MVGTIILVIFALFFWIMTIICMNVDWVMINGVNILPKEERQKFKEKHDMRAMNKFIGNRVFLPLAVLLSALTPLIAFEPVWAQSNWVGIVILVAIVAVVIYIVSAVPKILGNKFEK